ncbi:thioesterase family protein [Zavarzinia sp. CC-PAN008]|uniref:thioesterase family protein n=1 Tax=Zavarzinia sp. CC-PAN008 TaxID=3243332 RepID=UPI003F743D41
MTTTADLLDPGPAKVLPEWIDYNGHMNVAFYVLAFDQALDRLFERWDLSANYVKTQHKSFFVLENHITYQGEVKEGDPLRFDFQFLALDGKRMHYFMRMYHAEEGYLAATSEQVTMHVNMETRRSEAMADHIMDLLRPLAEAHAHLPRPVEAGRPMGIRKREPAAA